MRSAFRKPFRVKRETAGAGVEDMFKWWLPVRIHYRSRLFISPDRRVKMWQFNEERRRKRESFINSFELGRSVYSFKRDNNRMGEAAVNS